MVGYSMDSGDTAWILASSALVLLMTPGLAFFYGGLVRGKNVLGTIMHSFITIALVSVVWVLWGYSLAFGPDLGGGGDRQSGLRRAARCFTLASRPPWVCLDHSSPDLHGLPVDVCDHHTSAGCRRIGTSRRVNEKIENYSCQANMSHYEFDKVEYPVPASAGMKGAFA